MPSTASRGQICIDALSLAGRSNELMAACRGWLNYSLLDLGTTFRFSELRKIGSVSALPQGQSTAAIPSDIGLGMENSGMIFGPDNKPLQEVAYEEFANTRGFPVPNATGRPQKYIMDRNAGVFRFDCVADQAYPFTPVYFIKPPILPVDPSYDSQSIWLDNDIIGVHALIWWIYVFKEDPREQAQEKRVENLVLRWKRETVKMGGQSRTLLSPARFKNTAFGGLLGPMG